jgi:imidazolonepropionase-like amidohydrolase
MKKKSFIFILLAFAFLAFLINAQPDNVLVIKGGKILTISQGEIQNGIIIIESGKIKAVGKGLTIPEGANVIDASNGWILPGLIVAHTTLALRDAYGSSDSDEISNPNTAQLMVIDAINPFSKNIKQVRSAGITSAMITPGRSNVIGGQSAVVKLRGDTVTKMVLLSPAGVKFSLGEGPKFTYGKKERLPSTRMGSAFVIRNALIDAQDYLNTWKEYRQKESKGEEAKPPKRNLANEALAKVLEQELTAFIECYRADDIMTALRIIDEFKLKAVLVGCTEGHKIPEEIAKRKVPVIIGPMGVGPRRMETQDVTIKNPAILAKAGVKVVIQPDDVRGIGRIRELPLAAAFAVKGGLSPQEALRSITINAAEVLGVAKRIGSIEQGKDADIVIFDGDPFYYRTLVDRVIIDGTTIYERK